MSPRDFGKVAVLMGGRSAERPVSLKSGSMVLAALKKKGVNAHAFDPKERGLEALIAERFDRAFIALHGRYGEDGTLQGALELLGIPYTGSGVLASALALDKWRAKLVWQACGIPTPHCELLTRSTEFHAVAARLGLPLMVKPANEGSSIGMTKVKSARDLPEAYALAANYDRLVIAEAFVDGVELTAGVLGDTPLPLIELETPREFYDYEAKYVADDTRYIIPCGLPPDAERIIQDEALRAFRALACSGWGRVDLMLDRTGKPYFLEVNTSPGMTDHSLVPMAARRAGLSFEDLCLRILELARLEGEGGDRVE
jgi:D-alanine-D-alanine ligase